MAENPAGLRSLPNSAFEAESACPFDKRSAPSKGEGLPLAATKSQSLNCEIFILFLLRKRKQRPHYQTVFQKPLRTAKIGKVDHRRHADDVAF